MITAERLEELIKQEEWVWLIDDEQTIGLESSNKFHIFGLKLSNKFHIKDNSLRSEVETVYATLNNIFETKDRAEWALKNTAERIERFEPPMWEDIKDGYMFGFVNMEKHFGKTITFFVNKNGGFILIEKTGEKEPIWYEPATKENYIKACEIVRDLFNKGGAK